LHIFELDLKRPKYQEIKGVHITVNVLGEPTKVVVEELTPGSWFSLWDKEQPLRRVIVYSLSMLYP